MMNEQIRQILMEMSAGTLEGTDLEEKEFLVIQELCGFGELSDLREMYQALGVSGTPLCVPVLCAHLKMVDDVTATLIRAVISMIRHKAKERGSVLPDAFFTAEHFSPVWHSDTSSFLTYVQVIADIYVKYGKDENEMDRIGGGNGDRSLSF